MKPRLALIAALLLAALGQAEAGTLGVHTVSLHAPDKYYYEDFNPGLYYRFDGGAQIGAYRNSLGRTTVYAAQQFELGHGFSVLLGAGTGYQKKLEQEDPRGANGKCTDGNEPPCYVTRGHSSSAIAFVGAVSWVSPPVIGCIRFRTLLMPGFLTKSSSVAHLSMECPL